MRERDLERATQIHAQIKKLEEDFGAHDKFGKCLRLFFEFDSKGHDTHETWVDVSIALDLHNDTLHAKTNILIRSMLDEKMNAYKAELRKLGVKLEGDEPVPKAKEPKQKLLPAPKNGGKE